MRELQKKEEQPKRGLERTSGEDIKNKIGGGEGYLKKEKRTATQ